MSNGEIYPLSLPTSGRRPSAAAVLDTPGAIGPRDGRLFGNRLALALVVDVRAGDVGGEEVGDELHPRELNVGRLREQLRQRPARLRRDPLEHPGEARERRHERKREHGRARRTSRARRLEVCGSPDRHKPE
jgi:hypothetical protein